MSDSEGGLPSEAAISQRLRDIVIALHKAGNDDELTVKRVRARAEKELGLGDGFLKTNSEWKQKSQTTIMDAVDQYCHEDPEPEPTPKEISKPQPKPVEKKKKAPDAPKGVKRKAAVPAKKAKKRRKTDSDDDLESDLSELSEAEGDPPKKTARRAKNVVSDDDEDEDAPTKTTRPAKKATIEEDSDDEPTATPVKKSAAAPQAEIKDDISESEMSSLIDESPKPKSRQKKEPAGKGKKVAKAKAAAPKAKSTKAKADDSPDAAEVKRLQGWLVKCGIRKVWSRDPELSKCDTDKEKISVLKRMLKEVGMDGKYSVEKAAKIKEKREFENDLAAIQEAEAHWGATEDTGGRPRRRAAAAAASKPQQKVVFSDDSEDQDSGDGDDKESSDDNDDDMDEDDNGASDNGDKSDSAADDSE